MERGNSGGSLVRLEDLERSMQDMQLPPGLPPGLDTSAAQPDPHHPTTFAFPAPALIPSDTQHNQNQQQQPPNSSNSSNSNSSNNNSMYDDFMTDKEKDIIARLHLFQLRSPNQPTTITDYYYQHMAKRGTAGKKAVAGDAGPLYFPALTGATGNTASKNPKKAVKATEFKVEGSLGSISKSSHHRPRTQFQAPTRLKDDHLLTMNDSNGTAEALLDRCLAVEEAHLRLAEDVEATPQTQQASHAIVEKQCLLCEQLLSLHLTDGEWFGDRQEAERLAALIDHQKGRKAVSRVIGLLSLRSALLLCERIIQSLEHVDLLLQAAQSEECLLQDLIPQMVACVSKADWLDATKLLQSLIDKPALPWLLQRKTGLVIACMVLSRLEVLKQGGGGEESLASDLERICEQLYTLHLADHLVDIFFTGATINTQYVWQFLALVAVNVDGDKKRDMVLELRETVMTVVNAKNPKHVKTMNVFLNALGLDASQLA